MSNYNKTVKTNRNFSYSYDENLTLGENSQNKLTFKMLKYIEHDGRYDINPFAAIISGGSQIKLTDKDNQVYIFTVTSPKYAIKRSNVEITYECMDSFSYKNTRQNSGYTISNDETSENFIGSQTLDQWAQKINDECKIKYKYIPTNEYIWIDKTGKYKHSLALDKTVVDRILREPLDADYNPALVFSISGSNALNANITLANDNGLVIKVNDQYQIYYFIPQKNPEFSGLYYSPQVDVKSLDISQDAASLTTLLNVTGPTFDDSEVTLIPTITNFFYDLFSRDEWGDISLENIPSTDDPTKGIKIGDIIDKKPSKEEPAVDHLSYADGMFEKLITERTLSFYNISNITLGKETIDGKEVIKYIDIPLAETIPNFYSNFKIALSSYFNDNGGGSHYFSTYKEEELKYYLVYKTVEKTAEGEEKQVDRELGENLVIDEEKGLTAENRKDVHLRIRGNSIPTNLTSVPFLQITFYRHNTQEDFEFARAADRIPWLENKLINFEYFLRKGILTENQYQELLKLVKENLRIANGYLLFYRKQYYDSLRQKTAYLANLDAMIDNYFANFEDGIISHYQNGEAISEFIGINKASSLTEAALKEIYYRVDPSSTVPMISADVTIGSTMTNYFNAQQNFLKNIYQFRNFWNTKCNIEAAKAENKTNGE